MEKDTEKNGIKSGRDPITGKFVEGNKLGGRPKGSRDFYTDFKEAIKRIKDKNTGEELTEQDIIKIGIEKMLKGDARFEGLYKDLMDRVYGKPHQTADITSGGEKIVFMPPEIANKLKPDATS